MSSEWDQTCLVCGIKTENRCSSCAKAGIDLFFCSPDHQKLVWKAHRRVCGPGKANPFMWPLLSPHEADDIVEHMHETTGMFAQFGHPLNSVAGAVKNCSGFGPEELPSLARSLTAHGAAAATPSQQRILGELRAFEVMRHASSAGPADKPLVAVSHDPIAALAFHEMPSTGRDRSTNEPWRAKYRHLMLIQLALCNLLDRTAEQQAQVVQWLDRGVERINDFVRIKIEPQQPQVALALFMDKPSEIMAARLSASGPAA